MILKHRIDEDWFVVDNIVEVSIHRNMETAEGEKDPHLVILVGYYQMDQNRVKQHATVRLVDEGYLLNDSGKTIETLICPRK